jgi:hypothetical protein
MTDKTRERIIYRGRRVDGKGKAAYAWLVPGTSQPMQFGKLKASAVGGIYSVLAEPRNEAGEIVTVYPGSLQYEQEIHDDAEQVAAWQVEDRLAVDELARAAAQRRQARNPELEEALEPLLRIARRLTSRNDAYAFARLVTERITEAWWTR